MLKKLRKTGIYVFANETMEQLKIINQSYIKIIDKQNKKILKYDSLIKELEQKINILQNIIDTYKNDIRKFS